MVTTSCFLYPKYMLCFMKVAGKYTIKYKQLFVWMETDFVFFFMTITHIDMRLG